MPDQPRIALVIGNALYQNTRQLKKTHADATAISTALSLIGFRSHICDDAGRYQGLCPYLDQSLMQMNQLLGEFTDAAQKASMAIIYFSGHGIEINSKNFLIPVDANLTNVSSAQYQTVTLSNVTSAVSQTKALGLVILDACRDNPFDNMKGLDAGKSLATGLARPEESSADVLVFYAAKEGQKAREGLSGPLSPFAQALSDNLVEPGRDLLSILGKVTQQVRTLTDYQQDPRFYGPIPAEPIVLAPLAKRAAGENAPSAPAPPHPVPTPDGPIDSEGRTNVSKAKFSTLPPSRAGSFAMILLLIGVGAVGIWFWFAGPDPSKYKVSLHTARPASEIATLTKALTGAGYTVGKDDDVDQPKDSSPLSGVDYDGSEQKNRAAAEQIAKIVNQALGTDLKARPQPKMQFNGELGVWLPSRGDYKVTIRFAGLNRENDIAPLSGKLRAIGWNAQDPQPPGSTVDRTPEAATLREVRYSGKGDLPAAEMLAKDLLTTGIGTLPLAVKVDSNLLPRNLQVWIGPSGFSSK